MMTVSVPVKALAKKMKNAPHRQVAAGTGPAAPPMNADEINAGLFAFIRG